MSLGPVGGLSLQPCVQAFPYGKIRVDLLLQRDGLLATEASLRNYIFPALTSARQGAVQRENRLSRILGLSEENDAKRSGVRPTLAFGPDGGRLRRRPVGEAADGVVRSGEFDDLLTDEVAILPLSKASR